MVNAKASYTFPIREGRERMHSRLPLGICNPTLVVAPVPMPVLVLPVTQFACASVQLKPYINPVLALNWPKRY